MGKIAGLMEKQFSVCSFGGEKNEDSAEIPGARRWAKSSMGSGVEAPYS
jgi:hypothetical protein